MRKKSKQRSFSSIKNAGSSFYFEGDLRQNQNSQNYESYFFNRLNRCQKSHKNSKHRSLTSLHQKQKSYRQTTKILRKLQNKNTLTSKNYKQTSNVAEKFGKNIFISKVSKKNEELVDKKNKMSKHLRKQNINFKKVDYVQLYSHNSTLKMGDTSPNYQVDFHDYSEQFIISKGTIKLKDSAKQFSFSDSENITSSSNSSDGGKSQDKNRNFDEIKNFELLNLTKKKSKQSQFMLFLSLRKIQCMMFKVSNNYPRSMENTLLGPIKIQDQIGNKLIDKLQNVGKNVNIPASILKKNKKKVKLYFSLNEQFLYFAFSIKRRERLDKRKSMHYRQKMLIACENHNQEQFRKYLGRYIRQCLYIRQTALGKKICSRQQDLSTKERISINQNSKEITDQNDSSFYQTQIKLLPKSLTIKKINLNKITLFTFIKIAKKQFLCSLQKQKKTSEIIVQSLYEFNQNAPLPKNHLFQSEFRHKNQIIELFFRKNSICKTFSQFSCKLEEWICRLFAKQVFGYTHKDIQQLNHQISHKKIATSDDSSFGKKLTIIEQSQGLFTSFTYQIQQNFQKGNIFPKGNKNKIDNSSNFRKKRRKGTQIKEFPQMVKKMILQAILSNQFTDTLKNEENICETKLDKKSCKKIQEFIKRSRRNKNFFKIRNSFDYGVRKGAKFFTKSYDQNYYQINLSNLTVDGFKNGKKIHLNIERQEQKQQILILNLPYHLDPELSRKLQDFILSKIIEQKNKCKTLKFCNQTTHRTFTKFQFIQKDYLNLNRILIFSNHHKRLDYFIVPKWPLQNKIFMQKQQYLRQITKKLRKYQSITYQKYSLTNPQYEILYKKVHKLFNSIYIVFILINIPSMRFTYLKMYNRKDQNSLIVEIPDFNHQKVDELISDYCKILSSKLFSQDIDKIKKRIEKKNRQLYHRLLCLGSFKQTKICLNDNHSIRINQRFLKNNNKLESNQKIQPTFTPDISQQLFSKIYKGPSKNRTFLIMVTKFLKNANEDEEIIKIQIIQSHRFIKYEYVMNYRLFVQKMSEKIKQGQNFGIYLDKAKDVAMCRLLKPIFSIIDQNCYGDSEIFLKQFSDLFGMKKKPNYDVLGVQIKQFHRYFHNQKQYLIIKQNSKDEKGYGTNFILYDPASGVKCDIFSGVGNLIRCMMDKNKKVNFKLIKRYLKAI